VIQLPESPRSSPSVIRSRIAVGAAFVALASVLSIKASCSPSGLVLSTPDDGAAPRNAHLSNEGKAYQAGTVLRVDAVDETADKVLIRHPPPWIILGLSGLGVLTLVVLGVTRRRR
jgi:hypothetical protein